MGERRLIMYKRILIILVPVLLLLPVLGQAQINERSSYHCGTEIIKPGDSIYAVKAHCGDPEFNVPVGMGEADDLSLVYEMIYSGHGYRIIIRIQGTRVKAIFDERI